jgi:hypothetical protein
MTVRPNPGTEPSMAKVGWIVQSAFYGRNSHGTRESSPTPCREAAQSNPLVQRMRDSRHRLQFGRQWSRTADHRRSVCIKGINEIV